MVQLIARVVTPDLPYTTYFNSTMVQLIVVLFSLRLRFSLFQFYYGSINSYRDARFAEAPDYFNSTMVQLIVPR